MTIETSGRPDPIKEDLLGLQSLVKFPSARVILVNGQDDFAAAQRMFPANPVLAWEGGTGALHDYYLGHLEDRNAIIWGSCPVPPVVREVERQLGVAGIKTAGITVFAPSGPMECLSPAEVEQRRLPRNWILPRLRPVKIDDGYILVNSNRAGFSQESLDRLNELRKSDPVEYERLRAEYEALHDPTNHEPPLPPPEPEPVGRPVASVTPITEARTRQQAKPAPNPADEYAPFADDAMARAFTEAHPELRYVARWGKWLSWGPDGWQEDDTLRVYDLARKVCCEIADATRGATPSAVSAAKSAGKRAAVENLARSDRAHAATADVWDADKLALNTPGGLVNLRDGSMRPARTEDYCRKRTAATPGGVCSQWDSFLAQCTDGDTDMQAYLARVAGMCATGDTREDFLGFIYGPGGNGKSVFIDTIQNILGSYAINAGIETFTEQKADKHTTELARLYGARMVVAQETEQGRRWAESRLKLLTGGGKVTARFMRCDDFEFTPELKLIIVGNHKPSLRNVDAAFRRRFHLIPFVHVPAVVDRTLRDKLWAERDGILLWLIAGCSDWLRNGLQAPESVRSATSEYFETQDIVGQWITDMCDTGPGCETTIRTLFNSYRSYCEGLHEFALRQGDLRDALLNREGITAGGYKNAPTIKGLRVHVDTAAHNARFLDS